MSAVRRFWWVGTVIALVAAGALVWTLWPAPSSRVLPPSRARIYTAFEACLVTDAQGVSGANAAPVWAGMEAASLATSGKVSFLAVNGPDTPANAVTYVNTLIQRKCDLILAVGDAEVAAARQQAEAFPGEHFVVVAAMSASSVGNVTVIGGSGSQLQSSVQRVVEQAADIITRR